MNDELELFSDFIVNQWSKHHKITDDSVQLDGIIGNVQVIIRVYMNYGLSENTILEASGIDLDYF